VNITRTDSNSKTAGPTARTSPSTTIAIDAMSSMLEANYSMKEQPKPTTTTTNIIKPNNEMIISNYDNYYNQYLTNMGLRDRILATLQYSAAMSSVRVTTTNDNKDEKKEGIDKVEEVLGKCSTAKQDAVPNGVLKGEDVTELGDKDKNDEVVELEDDGEGSTSTTPMNDEEEEDTQQVIVRGGLIPLPRSYVQERKDVCIPNAAWRKKQLIWDDVKKLLKEEEDGKQWPIRDEEPVRKLKSVQTADQLTREQVADQRIVQLNQLMRENVMLQKEAMLQKELLQREQEQDKKKSSEQERIDRAILLSALKNPQAMKDDPRLRRYVEVVALKYAQKQKALDGRQQQSTSLSTCEPKAKSPSVAVAAMAEVDSERIDRAILASAIKHPQAIKEDPLLRQQVEAIALKYAQKQRALDGEHSSLSKSKPTQHQSSQKIGRKATSPRSITLSNSKASDRGQTIKSTRPKKRVKMSEECPIVHIDHSKGSQLTIFERRSCFRHGIEDLRSGKGSNGVHATSPEQWTKESRSLDSDDIITIYNVVGTTFPTKLYGMLLLAENLSRSDIISWKVRVSIFYHVNSSV